MLVIRLTRKGRKNQPFFRVVVIDKRRSAKGGRAVEILGHVDPLTKKKALKKDRILHWIKMGAQPSDTVHNLLISEKIIVPTGVRSRILDKIGKGKKVHVARIKKSAQAVAAAPVSAQAGAPVDVKNLADKPTDKPVETAAPPAPAPEPVPVPMEQSKEEPKPEKSAQ